MPSRYGSKKFSHMSSDRYIKVHSRDIYSNKELEATGDCTAGRVEKKRKSMHTMKYCVWNAESWSPGLEGHKEIWMFSKHNI